MFSTARVVVNPNEARAVWRKYGLFPLWQAAQGPPWQTPGNDCKATRVSFNISQIVLPSLPNISQIALLQACM
jgi:hypothetical protein